MVGATSVATTGGQAFHFGLSGEARHQKDGDTTTRAFGRVPCVRDFQIEKTVAVGDLHRRLHHATKASRHPPGEHHARDFAVSNRLAAAGGEGFARIAFARREGCDVSRRWRRDLSPDAILRGGGAALRQFLTESVKGRLVEAESLKQMGSFRVKAERLAHRFQTQAHDCGSRRARS